MNDPHNRQAISHAVALITAAHGLDRLGPEIFTELAREYLNVTDALTLTTSVAAVAAYMLKSISSLPAPGLRSDELLQVFGGLIAAGGVEPFGAEPLQSP